MEIPKRHLRRRKTVAMNEFYDDQQQDAMIDGFVARAQAQSRLYRGIYAAALSVPTPAYIFARHCREHPRLAFLSLVSLLISIYTLRTAVQRADLLRRMNVVLASLVLVRAYMASQRKWTTPDLVWAFPVMGAVSALLLDRWLQQVRREISELEKKRYELRGA